MSIKKLKRIKTNRYERRLSLMLSGTRAGTAMLGSRATSWWLSDEKKSAKQSAALKKQAEIYVRKLGELKGSYVKIGQMMALFGEHLLPSEITDALHLLEHQTNPLHWHKLEPLVRNELGALADALDINPEPIAAASIGQVHRATIKATGEEVCLKIQYPGVADSIDNDFDDVTRMLKLASWSGSGRDLNQWLEEIKSLLKEEIDYTREAAQTKAMARRLKGDKRFLVPNIFTQYSTAKILTLEYLPGFSVTDKQVQGLSQARRNHLAESMLELFFKEVFEWGVLQTDPNFGNYRIQLADEKGGKDQLVLLDFGAVRSYPESFLIPLRQVIVGAYANQPQAVIDGAIALNCIGKKDPDAVKQAFAEFCTSLLEPLRQSFHDVPEYALNNKGEYRWRESHLVKRAGKLATKSALSVYFTLPPKEFILIARKLTGVFTFISTLGAEFNGRHVLEKYISRDV